jgi:hypothetical protein
MQAPSCLEMTGRRLRASWTSGGFGALTCGPHVSDLGRECTGSESGPKVWLVSSMQRQVAGKLLHYVSAVEPALPSEELHAGRVYG